MKLSNFEVLLLTISLFGSVLFFGFLIMIGRVYGGAESDNSYINFMMIVDVIPLFLFIKYLFSGSNKRNVAIIILVLLALTSLFGFGIGFDDITFKSILSFSIPSALIGILIAKSNRGFYFAKLLEPIMLFFTVVGLLSMRYILSVSALREVAEEGIGLNSLSYQCGFAFALDLYFLLFGNELPERFKYTQNSIYKYFSIILLIIQFVVGLSSGGRGGFVLLMVSGLVLLLIRFTHRKGFSVNVGISLTFIIIAAFMAIQFMPQNIVSILSRGSERTFSYITDKGFDASDTSNRDVVYEQCFKCISESPIIGHGILMKGTPFFGDRPHNLFLEILIQGGVFYLIVFVVLIIHLFKKMRLMIRKGYGYYIVPITLYPAVMLMFSASYISCDLFWFVISYILCIKVPKQKPISSF